MSLNCVVRTNRFFSLFFSNPWNVRLVFHLFAMYECTVSQYGVQNRHSSTKQNFFVAHRVAHAISYAYMHTLPGAGSVIWPTHLELKRDDGDYLSCQFDAEQDSLLRGRAFPHAKYGTRPVSPFEIQHEGLSVT